MKVNEIFTSISGEVGIIPQGAITTFIRFQSCNCRCLYCDTPKSQDLATAGRYMTPEAIVGKIKLNENVILTGGEPLLQPKKELEELIRLLKTKNCTIQMETNGTLSATIISNYYNVQCWVFDYKGPSSGMQNKMMDDTKFVDSLTNKIIKFVCKTEEDMDFAFNKIQILETLAIGKMKYAISIEPQSEVAQGIVEKIIKELPNVFHKIILNYQIHKIVGVA